MKTVELTTLEVEVLLIILRSRISWASRYDNKTAVTMYLELEKKLEQLLQSEK